MAESRAGRWLPVSVIAAVTAVSAFLVAVAPQPTSAAWTSGKAFAITATAATPTAVPTVGCGAASGLLAQAIPITWTAPAGATPSRYRLHWQGTAGTGDAYFTSSPGQVAGGLLSVLGTSTVTVYAEYGDWTAPVSLQSRTITTIAVVVVVSWTCA
jgi:hypothetical protein